MGVGQRMDFRRPTATRATDRLIFLPPFPPAAERCAFTAEESMRTWAGGGAAVTTSYIWCGERPCQARNASNSPARGYYAEGEFVYGAPAAPYYYGPDQIGSARRVFVSTSSAPAYSYDPYGNALQPTASLTDFNYAGMFFNPDSGLYLTQYRAYDPVAGRWLSRDPIEDESKRPLPLISDAGEDNSVRSLAADVPVWAQPQLSLRGGFLVSYGLDSVKQRNPVVTNGASSASWPSALNLYEYAWQNPIGQKDSSGLCGGSPHAPDGTLIDPAKWPTLAECLMAAMCYLSGAPPPKRLPLPPVPIIEILPPPGKK